jgi:hypothetical protein
MKGTFETLRIGRVLLVNKTRMHLEKELIDSACKMIYLVWKMHRIGRNHTAYIGQTFPKSLMLEERF